MKNGKLWTVVGIVVVIALVIGAYAIFHKPSKTTPTAPAATSTTQKTSTSTAVIQTKTSSSVGQYLASADGQALYTYGADTSGVSNCSGSCLYSWPAYDASNAPASLPTNVTVIKRSDGSSQYAYKGLPLYNFSSDSSGQVSGDGVSNFHVAKP